jgi:crotonobetainyl-CoA:carnitine CoA-transferase CaiB-like acyl-CoA transferase
MTLACEGLRVLDFGQGYGAIPGMILADYGADAVKVEPPGGEFFRGKPAFLQWNRGKKGVILDLKTAEGQGAAQALARRCDVVIENYRPGVASRLGIGYEELSKLNPGLVYLSISGFGRKGKYSNYKGYEGIVAAKTGQDVIQNGYRGDEPHYDAIFKCSFGASFLGLIGVLSALRAKEKFGVGQKVESSLVQANFVYSYGGIRAETPELSRRLSSVQGRDPHNVAVGYRIAQCKDGKWIQSGSSADPRIFPNMMRALGITEYFDDPRFTGGSPRFKSDEDRDYLISLIDAAYKKKTLEEWIKLFEEHDAAYGVFMTTQEFMDYPQVRHNGQVIEIEDPQVGKTDQIGPLVTFAGQTWQARGPAPLLGQHTEEVLTSVATSAESAPVPISGASNGPLPEGALNGVTILDLAAWAAAPGGPGLLADLGARVIKVEPPDGDPMGRFAGELFFRVNRGKERLAIDLKSPEGRDIIYRLVEKADVLLHNFRPGVPERLGLGYETLRKINPRLVYLYAASFGSSGPDAQRPAFDALISAMAGGEVLQAGEGNPPQQRQSTDHSALLGVAVAILLGLRARDVTGGQAQSLETTMLSGAGYLLSDDFIRYEGKPPRPVPDKGQYGLGPLYRLYRAEEDWVFLAVLTGEEWSAFCDAAGRSSWKEDQHFKTKESRSAHKEELVALLEPLFKERPARDWEEILQAQNVPCVVASETWSDFVFDAWDGGSDRAITTFTYPGVGAVRQPGQNVDLLKTPGTVGVCQTTGASTPALLAEIGYPPAQIEELRDRKIVAWAEG